MVREALTVTLYARAVLIFPVIIYTDSGEIVALGETRQSITHRARESSFWSFLLIVIPLKSTLIYCVLNFALLVCDVTA